MKRVDLVGWFLLFLAVLNFGYMLLFGDWVHVFWLCNHIPLILGICILMRDRGLLILEYSFLGVGMFGWVVDYFWKAFFDVYLFRSTEYLASLDPATVWSSVLLHILTLPLGLVAVWFGEYYNLNCFILPCLSVFPERFYPASLVVIYFGLCVFPLVWILRKFSETCANYGDMP